MTEYNAKIQEMERRLAAAEAELRALKAEKGEEDLPTPPAQRWMPHRYEHYYFYDSTGSVDAKIWCFEPGDIDREILGNVFMQRSDAEFAVERLKLLAQMREWTGKWNDPYRIIYIDGRVEPERVFVGRCISYGEIRFTTEADAKNCIKAVGEDRLKKYHFGIPEDDGCYTSER